MKTQYNTIIVGAGAVGAAAAYHLTHTEGVRDVLVIDREAACAQGSTGRSAAKVRDTVTARTSHALCSSSIAAYQHYQSQGAELRLDLMGYLWLMTETQRRRNEKAIEEMRENGIPLELLSPQDLSKIPGLSPPSPELGTLTDTADIQIHSALFGRNCGSIDPDLLTQFYLRGFLEKGGEILYRRNVADLVFKKPVREYPDPLFIDTSEVRGVTLDEEQDIYAENVILATGAYTPLLLEYGIRGLHSGLLGVKTRQLFEIRTDCFEEVPGFNDRGLPFTVLPLRGIYFYRSGTRRITIGCADERTFLDRDAIRRGPEPESEFFRNSVMPILLEYFPGLAGTTAIGTSAGFYDYGPGGLPIIEQIQKGLLVAIGTSGRGIMTADAIGRITAARVLGKSSVHLFGCEQPFQTERLGQGPGRAREQERFAI